MGPKLQLNYNLLDMKNVYLGSKFCFEVRKLRQRDSCIPVSLTWNTDLTWYLRVWLTVKVLDWAVVRRIDRRTFSLFVFKWTCCYNGNRIRSSEFNHSLASLKSLSSLHGTVVKWLALLPENKCYIYIVFTWLVWDSNKINTIQELNDPCFCPGTGVQQGADWWPLQAVGSRHHSGTLFLLSVPRKVSSPLGAAGS